MTTRLAAGVLALVLASGAGVTVGAQTPETSGLVVLAHSAGRSVLTLVPVEGSVAVVLPDPLGDDQVRGTKTSRDSWQGSFAHVTLHEVMFGSIGLLDAFYRPSQMPPHYSVRPPPSCLKL